jgi:hypothetical protein
MSSEVFLNGNVPFLLPFLIDLLIVSPTVKKIFNLYKKFPEKIEFFYNIISFSPRPFVNVIIPKSFLIIESKNYHSWDWNISSETFASYVFCMYFHFITSN